LIGADAEHDEDLVVSSKSALGVLVVRQSAANEPFAPPPSRSTNMAFRVTLAIERAALVSVRNDVVFD
ncbi:hypothetical protein, partial [Stenotrophomonas maltophilia]|uniref:hypothetical protein n=1 Tax=Stenotrophomonas maltophilia TaxID=40324 RepID=UPI0019531FFF